jgi:hypothetical protein
MAITPIVHLSDVLAFMEALRGLGHLVPSRWIKQDSLEANKHETLASTLPDQVWDRLFFDPAARKILAKKRCVGR